MILNVMFHATQTSIAVNCPCILNLMAVSKAWADGLHEEINTRDTCTFWYTTAPIKMIAHVTDSIFKSILLNETLQYGVTS